MWLTDLAVFEMVEECSEKLINSAGPSSKATEMAAQPCPALEERSFDVVVSLLKTEDGHK